MSLLDKLFTAQQGDDVVASLQRIATAFERIAAVAETFLPKEVSVPDKPMGPENIQEYAQDPSEEDIEDLRAKMRESGMSDRQIEDKLISTMFGGGDDDDAP
jgi:hypothetical protein